MFANSSQQSWISNYKNAFSRKSTNYTSETVDSIRLYQLFLTDPFTTALNANITADYNDAVNNCNDTAWITSTVPIGTNTSHCFANFIDKWGTHFVISSGFFF